MRKILFRGKTQGPDAHWLIGSLTYDGQRDDVTISDLSTHETAHIQESTFGRSTGYVDNDGRDIFEGDILRRVSAHMPVFYEVQWNQERGAWLVRSSMGDVETMGFILPSQFRIIGNIYDTPNYMHSAE